MSRKVFSLFGVIALDGMGTVSKQLLGLDKKLKEISNSLNKTGRDLTKLGTGLSKTFTAPIVAAAGAITVIATKTGEYADKILDLKEITGLSTTTLQEFEHVIKASGGDFEAFASIIPKFTNRLPEIIKGGTSASNAFSKLGVSLFNSNGKVRDMNELFPEMIYALQKIPNVTEKNVLAQDIFGRSLQELGPILGMTQSEVEALRSEAHSLGAVMSEDALRGADKFREETVKLKEQLSALGRGIASEVMPVFTDTLLPIVKESVIPAIKDMSDKVKSGVNWFNQLSPQTKENAIKFLAVTAALGPFLILLGKSIQAVAALRGAMLLLNSAVLANPWVLAAAAVVGFGVAISATHDNMKKLNEEMMKNNNQRLIYSLQELIYNFNLLKDIDKSPIDDETYDRAISDIKTLKENISGLGFSEFTGNFKKDMQLAIDKLDELTGKVKQGESVTAPTKNAGTGLSEEERNEALKMEEKLSDELVRIVHDRMQRIRDIREKNTKEVQRVEEDGLDREENLTEQWEKLQNKRRDDDYAATQAIYENHIKKEQTVKDLVVGSITGAFDVFRQFSDNKIAKLDQEYETEKAAIESSTLSQEEKANKLAVIEDKIAKKKKDVLRRQAMLERAAALFSIGISTAQAIMKGYADLGPIGGTVSAVLIGLLAIAQTAAVLSKPLPMAKGALVKGNRGGVNAEIGESNQDELVLPMRTGAQKLADILIEKLQSIEIPSFALPAASALAVAAGSSAGGYGGQVNHHWHIGTLIADDRGIKELERRQSKFRIGEAQRKGAA